MAGKSSERMKEAARLRAQRYLEKDPEHYAKMAAKSARLKIPKRGMAALKESDPERAKEIQSMGGKSRWKASATRKARDERSKELQQKIKHQRKEELDKLRKLDEREVQPKPKRKKPAPKPEQKETWDGEEKTGW